MSRLIVLFKTGLIATVGAAAIVVAGVTHPVYAASDTYTFNAGRIIDDAVFTNTSTLSVAQIQSFLNSKVASCDTNGAKTSEYGGGTRAQYAATKSVSAPFTCLKDYSENGRSAAQIISDTANQYGINPQVLIVLLQKEQGLVTDDWPWLVQYQKATGYGCPDTAPCDSQYFGLTNQLTWSAKMFHAIMIADPNWYTPYIVGNDYIQYSPSSSCGGSTVAVQNRATQALYNYTPYQPNAAVLAAAMGSTVNCGAYGNVNFFRYFTQWFGATTGPDYAWQLNSSVLYYDAGYTQQIPQVNGTYSLIPGQKAYVKVSTTNIGRSSWPVSMTRLATQSPMDRPSLFADSGWMSFNRTVPFSESSAVAPNGTATFKFSITAPQTTTMYNEAFAVVIDGTTWINNMTMNLKISVPAPESTPLLNANTSLGSGSTLPAGGVLLSSEGHTALHLTSDGNLELWTNYKKVWSTNTAGSGADRLTNENGNLTLYKESTVIWSSGTSGAGSTLVIQSDGNVVLYSATNVALWSTATIAANQYGLTNSTFLPDEVLFPGQSLVTSNRFYRFVIQGDGNIVLYAQNHAVWSSGSLGKRLDHVNLQADGNIVAYTLNNTPLWATNTSNTGANWLEMQSDGNLVMYATGRPIWSTNTFQAR